MGHAIREESLLSVSTSPDEEIITYETVVFLWVDDQILAWLDDKERF